MWRAAGAHIVSWYRHDTDLAVDLNLAAVLEFFLFLFGRITDLDIQILKDRQVSLLLDLF